MVAWPFHANSASAQWVVLEVWTHIGERHGPEHCPHSVTDRAAWVRPLGRKKGLLTIKNSSPAQECTCNIRLLHVNATQPRQESPSVPQGGRQAA